MNQGLVKGAILCFSNPYFYFRHGESTSTVCQLTSPASQKSKDLNKASLLLQDLVFSTEQSFAPCTCYYLTRIKEGYFDRTQKNIASLCFTLESKLWLQNFSYHLYTLNYEWTLLHFGFLDQIPVSIILD